MYICIFLFLALKAYGHIITAVLQTWAQHLKNLIEKCTCYQYVGTIGIQSYMLMLYYVRSTQFSCPVMQVLNIFTSVGNVKLHLK